MFWHEENMSVKFRYIPDTNALFQTVHTADTDVEPNDAKLASLPG